MQSGELKRLKITAYRKPSFQEGDKLEDGEFQVQINPESYTQTFEIKYDDTQAPGTSDQQPKYDKTKPQKLEFEFIFDSTGAVPGTTKDEREDPTGILSQIEQFKKVVFQFDGESHRPLFLLMIWGRLLFKCVLVSMSIQYKLFRPDGTPVRAAVKAAFQGLTEDSLRVSAENKQSPDLTKVRVVKAGDTLPRLCTEIYGNPEYYYEVARVNKIVNFRSLEVGQRIEFPPIEKN
ncbi:MAG: LysM peptidoglycan-binding domain-containing protein [Bacteroidota bacterium]